MHRGSERIWWYWWYLVNFWKGGQVAPIYTPRGFWPLPPPPFLFVFLCVVATWLPLLPLHKEINYKAIVCVCVSHLEDRGVRIGEVGGTWIDAEGGKYTSHEL